MSDPACYFFVCGAPKSGTTWVQFLLDAHPEIVCSGEGHFIERLIFPLRRVKEEYNRHLGLVTERVYQGKPFYHPLSDEDVAFIARSLVERLMGKRSKPGAKFMGDKTPRYTEFLFELRALFPEARFIHIVRDPRDVTVSRLHHALRAGFPDALSFESPRYQQLVLNSIAAWNTAQTFAAKFAGQYAEQFMEIRYEDLSGSPDESVERLFLFVGVQPTRKQIEDAVAAASFETLSGRKRGEEDKRSFFRKGISGDWRGVLDQSAEDKICEACGFWMARKGYGAADQTGTAAQLAAAISELSPKA